MARYSNVHNAAPSPFMHKHIESIWNLEHHHIKENISVVENGNIHPSLFVFLPSSLPIPSVLFYLFLPSRGPVALNIGRHLYSDPGSIVKVFQHMMAL